MICRFIPKIDFETIRNTSTRYYEVRRSGELIATSWVKDLHVRGLTEKQDRAGALNFNNNVYHIGPNVRYGSEWPFYDQFNKKIMNFYSEYDEIMVEKKKMFSKKTFLKKQFIYYEKVFLNNRTFKVYVLSLGVDGQYYVIKENEKTVSMIYVHDDMTYFAHELDLYMENDKDVVLLTLLYSFALNMFQFYQTDERIIHGDSAGKTSWSKSKPYILEKFDPEFIERIKKQENNNI